RFMIAGLRVRPSRTGFPPSAGLLSSHPMSPQRSNRAGGPVTISERELVAALELAIAQRIGEPRYKLWFERHTRLAWDDDLLTVGVPNRHFQEWLEKTFTEPVAAAAGEVFEQPMRVRFTIDPELFRAARREQAEVLASRPV